MFHERKEHLMCLPNWLPRRWWQAVGPDPAAWEHEFKKAPTDAFTTLFPGLFAGGGQKHAHSVLFDYFRFYDNEEFPIDEV